MNVVVQVYLDGQMVSAFPVAPKEFKSGSTGFFATTKVTDLSNPNDRYQTQVTMTKIGSKPKK